MPEQKPHKELILRKTVRYVPQHEIVDCTYRRRHNEPCIINMTLLISSRFNLIYTNIKTYQSLILPNRVIFVLFIIQPYNGALIISAALLKNNMYLFDLANNNNNGIGISLRAKEHKITSINEKYTNFSMVVSWQRPTETRSQKRLSHSSTSEKGVPLFRSIFSQMCSNVLWELNFHSSDYSPKDFQNSPMNYCHR